MRLVFIYDAPAVGKLAAAREPGRLSGLAVFDNHLSFDCARAVFGFGTPTTARLVGQVRHLVIGEAAPPAEAALLIARELGLELLDREGTADAGAIADA